MFECVMQSDRLDGYRPKLIMSVRFSGGFQRLRMFWGILDGYGFPRYLTRTADQENTERRSVRAPAPAHQAESCCLYMPSHEWFGHRHSFQTQCKSHPRHRCCNNSGSRRLPLDTSLCPRTQTWWDRMALNRHTTCTLQSAPECLRFPCRCPR